MNKRAYLFAALTALASPVFSAEEEDRQKIVFEFLGNYCLECHDTSVAFVK